MTYQKSCEWCVYRDKNNPDICKNCSYNGNPQPKFELGKVDIFKLAEGLKQKRQEQNNKPPESEQEGHIKNQPNLIKCPYCGKIFLFFNEANKKHECLNLECKSRKLL